MELTLELDRKKCVGCGACAVACMDQNDFEAVPGAKPFRLAVMAERPQNGTVRYTGLSAGCMHCTDAPCIRACPRGRIYKDEETGLTVCDTSGCIGCRSCAVACPYGAPCFGADGKMVKCDGCVDRIRHGLEPACVRVCPFDALTLGTRENAGDGDVDRPPPRPAGEGY